MKRIATLLLLLLLNYGRIWAQNQPIRFSRLDIGQGLSHNQVNTIFRDEQGFIWFGTMSGLNRYDGYNFKIFRRSIKDTNSISDDYISQIVQGPEGKLWIATRNGWNIYDPATEKFTRNTQSFLQHIGIAYPDITDIKKDAKGNFWFIHPQNGLYQYNPKAKKIIQFQAGNHLLYSDHVTSVAPLTNGDIWIIYAEGKMDKMDGRNYQITFRTDFTTNNNKEQQLDYRSFADAQSDIWIYASNNAKGLYYYNNTQNKLLHFTKEDGSVRLNSNIIYGITQDAQGHIWIGTDHGGINVLDKKTFAIRYLLNSEADAKSISQNSIYSVYRDNTGIIWVGTFKKGVNYYHEEVVRFPLYKHSPTDANSIEYDDVNNFVEDAKGNIWIGTNGGGLIYFNRSTGRFTQYVNNPSNPNSLSNNVIVSLYIDRQQKLWIGTYYGGLNCFDGKRFIHYRHNDNDNNSIADDRVWEIMEDSQNRLWIGTLTEGLDLMDRENNRFIHHQPNMLHSIHSGYISALVEDRLGNIWIGTSEGIDILEKSMGRFTHFTHSEKDKASLSNNNVISMVQDSRGWVWVGTRDGLNVFDTARHIIKIFRQEDGLPDNTISTLVEDDNHTIWLSTPNGLSNIIIENAASGRTVFHFKNYDESDGLQGREFNENAALKTRNGELLFGGANGFNLFYPNALKATKRISNLVLTDFQIFNNSIPIGEEYNKHIILPQSISLAKEIKLKYNENVFSIEFAALDFYNADKIKYAYKLQGFNNDWLITDGKNHKATFTNLDPGDYWFKVKVADNDGSWDKKELSLKLTILPPFWKTPLAYIVYILLLAGILWYARYMVIRRAKLRFALEQERSETQRMHELDMMKIKFLTNVSHEFRTPLSLIITPLEKIIRQAKDAEEKKQFHLIHRNARRLLNLVNQLLDFRKLETQELKINATGGDMVRFIKELCYSFTDLAENKNISFSFHTSVQSLPAAFDHDKIERILFNLLSNAFKFTPEGGEVSVTLNVLTDKDSTQLELKIKDSGIGIEKEKQEKIFDRFFQNDIPDSMVNQGSGIGLAITREFVRLHNGTITVESEPQKGSCFTLLLPIEPINDLIFYEAAADEADIVTEAQPDILPVAGEPGKKKKILLVEDNEDFRTYLRDSLKDCYTVIEAPNGKLGWQKALATHPDIIVSDISMPEMNGIEMCQKIKKDKRTSFVPVILLTALTGEEQQLKGLETGANDYITKPFNFEILQSKIKNLLSQQETFKKTYQKQVAPQPGAVKVENPEERFIQNALQIVDKNMANADFSVEDLSRELFLSRVALYKKLLALTGKTPIEFIRSLRLKRAAQLLEKSDLTIAEVAYEVGFNNPKYFTKYFKAEYDMLPSAYQQRVPSSKEDGK